MQLGNVAVGKVFQWFKLYKADWDEAIAQSQQPY